MKPLLKAHFNQICFGLAIISQLFHAHIFFTYTGSDRNQQILASVNFLDQQGFSAIEANLEDLSQKVYEPIIGWPPGYNYLIVGINSIVDNWFVSAEILALLGALLVLISIHRLLLTLKEWIHPQVYPTVFLFLAISFTPFHYTTASGEWALSFFLIGVTACLKFFKKEKGIALSAVFLTILPFFLAGLMRYFYYPFVFLLPGVIFLMFFFSKIKRWPFFLKSAIIALIAFVGLLIIDFPAHSKTGTVSEMAVNKGLYWESLLRFDAFPIKAFFYFSLEGMTNKLGGIAIQFVWLAKSIMFLTSGFLIGLLFYPFSLKSLKNKSKLELAAWLIMIIVLLVSTGLLTILSLKSPTENYGNFIWTYVRETRYFAPILVFFQVYLFHLFFSRSLKNIPQFLLTGFLILGFTYSFGHSMYRFGQRIISNNPKETRFDHENCAVIEQLEMAKRESDKTLIWVHDKGVLAEDEAVVMGWQGVATINIDDLLRKGIQSSKEIELLVKVDKEKAYQLAEKSLIRFEAVTTIPICEGDTIYQLIFTPHGN